MSYKYLISIVRNSVIDALREEFLAIGVPGLSISNVKGFGEYKNLYSISHLTEHVQVEIFVDESMAEAVVNAIMHVARSGAEGDGIVAVVPVEKFFHVRTGSATLPDES